jgi:hypothetical protein
MSKERNTSETPSRWVVVKIDNNLDKPFYKVFATCSGGYLGGDRWKLNSGIKSVESDENYYYFIGQSGSCYKCHKNGYGIATSYGESVLNDVVENSYKVKTKVSVMPENTEWETLID